MNYLNYIYLLNNGDTIKFCEHYSVLTVFYFVKSMITLASIFVPIILIVMASIDVVKVVISGDVDKELKLMSGKLVKRTIFAVGFFLLPSIISLLSSIVGFINYDVSKCWTDATKEKITVLREQNESQDNEYQTEVEESTE